VKQFLSLVERVGGEAWIAIKVVLFVNQMKMPFDIAINPSGLHIYRKPNISYFHSILSGSNMVW